MERVFTKSAERDHSDKVEAVHAIGMHGFEVL